MSLPLHNTGDSTKSSKKLGELNGPWAIAFKFAMVTYPLVLSWGVWITTEQFQDRIYRETVFSLRGIDNDHEARLRILEEKVSQSLAILTTQQQEIVSRISRIETKIDALAR